MPRSAKAANALKAMGIAKGDLVALYMPMVPEAAIAMLACARTIATHSVVFGGFSPRRCRTTCTTVMFGAVITADGGFRKDKPVSLVGGDAALADGACPSVHSVLVVQRTKQPWTVAGCRSSGGTTWSMARARSRR